MSEKRVPLVTLKQKLLSGTIRLTVTTPRPEVDETQPKDVSIYQSLDTKHERKSVGHLPIWLTPWILPWELKRRKDLAETGWLCDGCKNLIWTEMPFPSRIATLKGECQGPQEESLFFCHVPQRSHTGVPEDSRTIPRVTEFVCVTDYLLVLRKVWPGRKVITQAPDFGLGRGEGIVFAEQPVIFQWTEWNLKLLTDLVEWLLLL
jgi:hypothetical protein